MVYRGKPSAACAECRKRRSRCDRVVPACGQCKKAGRICSGYRNTIDLMFHDESSKIVGKNENRLSEGAGPSNPVALTTGYTGVAKASHASPPPVKLTDFVLYQPLEELGVNFFMSTYIGDDPEVSILYYLPKFYARTGYNIPGLQQSITATGLAGWAKSTGQTGVLKAATKSYTEAIQSINMALSDPQMAVQDSTLLSIIMMAMFEVLVSAQRSGMQNCSTHLEGAVSVALLSIKTRERTDTMRRLFSTLAYSVIINCWAQNIPLPSRFLELKDYINEDSATRSAHGSFLDILLDLIQFREALRQGQLSSPIIIINEALAIDESLQLFAREMSQGGTFQSFRIPTANIERLAYEGYYHVYNDRFVAHIWNNIRSSRLYLNRIILEQCSAIATTLPATQHNDVNARREESEALITDLAIEIVASVPQLAGTLSEVQNKFESRDPGVANQMPSGSSNPQFHELPSIKSNNCSSAIEYSQFFVYDPPPFKERRIPMVLKGPPVLVWPTDTALPLVSERVVPLASLYHLLCHLYGLQYLSTLPPDLQEWIHDCIAWLEGHADPEDLVSVQVMAAKGYKESFVAGQ